MRRAGNFGKHLNVSCSNIFRVSTLLKALIKINFEIVLSREKFMLDSYEITILIASIFFK